MPGRLKLFFGAAPGVGKTFAMLAAARRARRAGADVVLGVVDTHGSPDTEALLDGLEQLPRAGGALDLEAALARRPAVILVDDLARPNPPGGRHLGRWQDAMELLEAGIDVHATLEVGQLESLRDVIAAITGAPVAETVPDAVLERADELELIDRAPEPPIDRGRLSALRALALRRAAEQLDVEVPTGERIMVCVGPSPGSERLIRAARRISERLRAPWIAAHVERAGAPPLGDVDRDRLEGHLRLAESLGGETVRLRGARVADALLAHARARNVTRLIAGKPTHPRWRDRLRGSLHDDLIRGSGAIDVLVISPIADAAPPAAPRAHDPSGPWAYLTSVVAVAVTTGLGLAAFGHVDLADVAMLYLIAIVVAALAGRGPAVLASSLAVLSFDFCFVPPRFTFAVAEQRHVLTFAVMFGAGLAISTLMLRLRRQEADARRRARDTAALLAFTRDVRDARDAADVAVALVRHVEEVLDAAAAVLLPDDSGALSAAAGLTPLAPHEIEVARWAFEHRQKAGQGTRTLVDAHSLAAPLVALDAAVGVALVQPRPGSPPLDAEQRHLLDALVTQAALAIGRSMLAAEAREAELRARTEELRSSLLSVVSHDLRTPLAVITGAATSLRDDAARLTPAIRAELLDTLIGEARRLEQVIANLLGMTRVETGIEPAREWVPVEELVGAALARVEQAIGDREVNTDVPGDLSVHVDPVLFAQVLVNLFENAVKHGAPPIEVGARRRGEMIEIDVADHGGGLRPGDEDKVFDKFYRASTAPGVGLGLAVVRGIVVAHGGTITAVPGEGARFRIELPSP